MSLLKVEIMFAQQFGAEEARKDPTPVLKLAARQAESLEAIFRPTDAEFRGMIDNFLVSMERLINSISTRREITAERFLRAVAEGFECEGASYCQLDGTRCQMIEGWFSGSLNVIKNAAFPCSQDLASCIIRGEAYTQCKEVSSLGWLYEKGVRSICAVPFKLDDVEGFLAVLNGQPRGDFRTVFTTYHESILRILSSWLFVAIAIDADGMGIGKESRRMSADYMKDDENSREIAWHTYLQHEAQLLREHRGEYAWVVGDEIRAVCPDRVSLCRKVKELWDGRRGITVRIEKTEPPTFDIPSPQVE